MNIEIYDTGTSLHLPPEFELETSFKNPLFSEDEGSGTLPAKLPGTPHNFKAFGFPERIDATRRVLQRRVRVTSGIYQRMGTATILDADKSEGININIGFDEGEFWNKINNLSLPELFAGKKVEYGSAANAVNEMNRMLTNPNDTDEFSVFEILLDVAKNDERMELYKLNEIEEFTYLVFNLHEWRYVHSWRLKYQETWKEYVLFNNEWIETENAQGYGISPFLKLSVLLDKIFEILGYSLIENPFKTDADLKKIVVLNNNRDSIMSGTLLMEFSSII